MIETKFINYKCLHMRSNLPPPLLDIRGMDIGIRDSPKGAVGRVGDSSDIREQGFESLAVREREGDFGASSSSPQPNPGS